MARLFERLLEQHERRRHMALLTPPGRAVPAHDDGDGFVSVGEAAKTMRRPPADVARMAREGVLEWRAVGGRILVRPAVVSRLGVRQVF